MLISQTKAELQEMSDILKNQFHHEKMIERQKMYNMNGAGIMDPQTFE